MKKRILTGDTPTGKLHLGHFVGTLSNRVKLQNEYETYIILANIHAYAKNPGSRDEIVKNTFEVAIDNLAVGLDPKVSTIFLESAIPEIAELNTYFSMLVSHSRALRNPTVKDEIKYKGLAESVSFGFVGYPILQAADILAFKADVVPVGEDQLPHLEQTREIARRFNELYGQTFSEPEGLVGKIARLPGIDGKPKMSKSLGNCIYLSDSSDEVTNKVKTMFTDPSRVHATDPGKVDGNPVFIYHDAFNADKSEVLDLKDRYTKGKVGDVEVKSRLAVALNRFLDPIRERRSYFEKHHREVVELIEEGSLRARKIATETITDVRAKMGLNL